MELVGESLSTHGRMVALRRGEGYVLRDPSGARAEVRLDDFPPGPGNIRFSSEAQVLAVLDSRNCITLWNADTGQRIASALCNLDRQSWTEQACSIVNRNLTIEEWETYLPGEAYRMACPGLPKPRAL